MDTPTKKQALLDIEAEMLRLKQQLAGMPEMEQENQVPECTQSPRHKCTTIQTGTAHRQENAGTKGGCQASKPPVPIFRSPDRRPHSQNASESQRTSSTPAHSRRRKEERSSGLKSVRAMSTGDMKGSVANSGAGGSDSDSTVTDHEVPGSNDGSKKRTFEGTVMISPQALRSFAGCLPSGADGKCPNGAATQMKAGRIEEWKEGERVAIFVKQINKWCPGRVIKFIPKRQGNMKLQILFQYAVGGSKKRARVTLGARSLGLVRKAKEIQHATQAPPPTPSGGEALGCTSGGREAGSNITYVRKLDFEEGDDDIVGISEGSQASTLSLGSAKSPVCVQPTRQEPDMPVCTRKKVQMGGLAQTRSKRAKKRKYKILVVGNSKCGKTSIINRYVRDYFTDDYKYTIGCDYSQKDIVDEQSGVVTTLRLWDIAGQDRFIQMNRPFFRNAVGAVVVCDVARKASIDAACEWKAELERCLNPTSTGYRVPVILIANKVDTLRDVHESFVIGAYVQKTALNMHFDGWFIGSAKKNEKITEAMEFLLQKVNEEQEKRQQKQQALITSKISTISLSGDGQAKADLHTHLEDDKKEACLLG